MNHQRWPRLAKAWDEEQEYQAILAAQRKSGQIELWVAMEELVRNIRLISHRNTRLISQGLVTMSEMMTADRFHWYAPKHRMF